jgi:tetratricopeptide (TPR) repeat protein
MDSLKKYSVLFISLLCLLAKTAVSQDIQGCVVKVKFGAKTVIVFKDGIINVRVENPKYERFFTLNPYGAKPCKRLGIVPVEETNELIVIVVEEGSRTHKFILKPDADKDDNINLSVPAEIQKFIKKCENENGSNVVIKTDKQPDPVKIPAVKDEPKKQPLVTNEDKGNYLEVFTAAQALYDNGQLDEAEAKFMDVLKLKPDYNFASLSIELIKNKRVEIAKKKKKEIDDKYFILFGEAELLDKAKKYQEEIAKYVEMDNLKPEDPFAKNQIAGLRKKIEDEKKERERIEAENRYQELITAAENAFKLKEYSKAKMLYKQSLTTKNDEAYVTRQLDKIDKAEEDDKRETQNRLREQEYENFMLLGDKNYKTGLYQQAKEAYEKAVNVKPNDKAATTKINESLSQMQRLAKDLEDKQKESLYSSKLAMAKKSEEAGNYNNAIAALNEAHDIKHEETFTRAEIARINNLVNGLAIKEKLDKQKQQTEEEYSLLIAGADDAFKAGDYAKAKAGYLQAKNKINNRTYPDEKMALIAKALQQQVEENKLLEAEQKRQSLEAALKAKYNTAITSGDNAFNSGDLASAIRSYKEAIALKPTEDYARQKIDEIRNKLDEEELAKKAEKRKTDSLRVLYTKFNDALQKGQTLFKQGNFVLARTFYVNALELKADDIVTQKNIEAVDNQLREIARQEALENKYDSLLSVASQALATGANIEALENFKKASDVKSFESYPKTQIRYLEKEIAFTNKRKAEEDSIRKVEEKNAMYKVINDEALRLYKIDKDYEGALKKFKELLALDDDGNGQHIRWKNDAKDFISICENQLRLAGKDVPTNKTPVKQEKQEPVKQQPEINPVVEKPVIKTAEPLVINQEKPVNTDTIVGDVQIENASVLAKNLATGKEVEQKPEVIPAEVKEPPVMKANLPVGDLGIKNDVLTTTNGFQIPLFETQIDPVPVELIKKYPSIDFNKLPQSLNTNADVTIIRPKSKALLFENSNIEGLKFAVNNIILNCIGIYFTEGNAYLRFRIQNNGEADFLTGPMLLTWNKKDGRKGPLNPGYISSFPIVQPGKQVDVMYVTVNVSVEDAEALAFEMTDRLGKTKIALLIPGKEYNNAKRKAQN